MNKKLVFLGILLLVGLTLSGCVTVGGYGYGYGGYGYGSGYGYGYYSYPHSYGYYNYDHGYPYRHPQPRDWDDHHRRSDHGSRYWR